MIPAIACLFGLSSSGSDRVVRHHHPRLGAARLSPLFAFGHKVTLRGADFTATLFSSVFEPVHEQGGEEVGRAHRGHRTCPALTAEQTKSSDAQAHAARALWNLLHEWWTMVGENRWVSLTDADAAIRQARKDIDFLAVLPAQAAQAVLRTYFQAWRTCWDGHADEPTFKSRPRPVMSVDVPQGRDLNVPRVHRRWGMANPPQPGRVRFRWTRDLPVGKRANAENRITGARLAKDSLGWHIAFRVQTLETEPETRTGPEVGGDVGATVPLTLSEGNHQNHGRPHRTGDGTADQDKWLTPTEKAKLLRLERRPPSANSTTLPASAHRAGCTAPSPRRRGDGRSRC
ncbi:hypothetical protein [Nocardiopsis deserti]|uniref:hypothetical protein n=1 Tax=Nocardiopsis deserti TaxID=2605988 RepID=UPI001CC221A9|nr:hypothetical protein [Nocardiopsis deserti]